LLPNVNSEDIYLGNIYEDKITDILNRAEKNKFTSLVMLKGLKWIVEKIDESKIIELEDYYINGCHFCNEIHKGNKYERIKPFLEESYNDIAISALLKIRNKRSTI
jgi:hypothetical protein